MADMSGFDRALARFYKATDAVIANLKAQKRKLQAQAKKAKTKRPKRRAKAARKK